MPNHWTHRSGSSFGKSHTLDGAKLFMTPSLVQDSDGRGDLVSRFILGRNGVIINL